jgi:two-component system response regulator FixJ
VNRGYVYVVDDDPVLRKSIVLALRGAGFDPRPFACGEDLLDELDYLPPGGVLLDVQMPGMSGLEVQALLLARRQDLPLIIMSGYGDIPMAVAAIKAGAFDFIEKPFNERLLIDVLENALDAHGGRVAEHGRQTLAKAQIERLNARERDLIEALLNGLPNKAAAHQLGLSVRTVEMYRGSLLRKLGVRTIVEAVQIAIDAGLRPGNSDVIPVSRRDRA